MPEGSRRVERLSHLVDGNNRRCLPDQRKGMRRPGKSEDVKKKIHARARKVLYHRIGNFVWASGGRGGEVGGSRKKFSESERRAKVQVRLHRACGSAELSEIASGSATQSLWLKNGKVGFQVSGIDRSRFPGRRTVRKVRRGGRRGRRASDRTKERVTDLGLDLGEREEQVACHATALALAMTDEARQEAEM